MSSQQDLQISNKDIVDLQIVLRANRSISGRVIMERGEPLPQDRTVLLFTENDSTSFGTGIQQDGTFLLSNVSTGLLHLELTGLADNFFLRSARSGTKDVLREGLSLLSSSVESVVVVIASQAGSVEGFAYDDRQSPAVDAHVVLLPATDRRGRPDLVKTAKTDQYGHFAIRGLTPGDYKAFAWDDSSPISTLIRILWSDSSHKENLFVLTTTATSV